MKAYFFLNGWAKVISSFLTRGMKITGKENVPNDKPTIYAVTHANSFYDAIALFGIANRDIYALARGDAFNSFAGRTFLYNANCLPIWRLSEGKKNMVKNKETFEKCHQYLKEDDSVLIFSEGVCKNQKKLLPLKRGTAEMALNAWNDNIDVQVLPVAVTYESFKGFGWNMNINYNKPLSKADFDLKDEKAYYSEFNTKLSDGISAMISHEFEKPSFFKKPLFYLGWLINFPLYFLLNWFVKKKFGRTVFFHSILFGALYLTLALYWLILGLSLYFICN